MYSESDIAQAVEAGVLSPEAAAAFRDHVAAGRSAPRRQSPLPRHKDPLSQESSS